MRAVMDRSREMVLWAAARIEDTRESGFPNGTRGMGIENSAGEIMAAVCFSNWDPRNRTIEVSVAADDPRWLLARKACRDIFVYAFETAKVDKIWSRTPARNERALRTLKALKFNREAVLPRQFGDDDAVISSMFREDYFGQG